MADDTSVQVTVRVRPQLGKERIDMCQVCTSVTPGEPQIVLGKDKAFTFDIVEDMDSFQQTVYDDTARSLIDGTFEGYNATVFAYGQTGSGKTYTMGTGFDVNTDQEEVGIIPRAVEHLFGKIDDLRRTASEKGEPPPDFKVNAQFMELYNEEILDLLDTTRDPSDRSRKSHIKIHEDAGGGIYTVGVTTRHVNSLSDTIHCLKIGALSRTTASTNMNSQSSRSHAIFTLHIKQQRVVKEEVLSDDGKDEDTTETINEFETLTAKFHFVDLAGSERLKRTGATGDRAKEGISINCGLLALGNVISALGDKAKKGSHVPYRDSKLTRLLQDSLGGNSRTVMIACVSPSDRDFMETLNTLKYANRARNIKNKVTVNQDKTSKQIAALRTEIQELQLELIEYRSGKRVLDPDGVETINDMFHENTMLQTENNNIRQRIKALQETVETLTARNAQLLAERDLSNISNMSGDTADDEVKKLIEGYIKEIEELRTKLIESEAMAETVKRMAARTSTRASMSPMHAMVPMTASSSYDFSTSPSTNLSDLLSEAKKDVRKMKKKTRVHKHSQGSDKENISEDEKQDLEEAEHVDEGLSEEDHEDADEEDEDDDEIEDELSAGESESEELKDLDEGDHEELHNDLANLTCEISIKQKLIEELEQSQRRLNTMKVHYEDKLLSLQSRIKETEVERDRVLSNLGDIEAHSEDKAKKIKEEYSKKLNDLQNDLKKMQAAKKEHAKLLRNQSHYEKQLKTLQRDLGAMKQLKCKLMNQIKEETQKTRQSEMRHTKEVAKLKKEQRLKDNQIRTLEADKRRRDLVLRRKQEEVEALRKKQQRPLSAKVAGRVGKYDKPATVPVNPISPRRKKREFSAKVAKVKWDALEKSMSSVILKRQTLGHMERDMERWIKQRESLGKKIEKFMKKKQKAETEGKDPDFIKDLTEQIDSLRANISYVQDNINECQSNIMGMEETKDEEQDPSAMLTDCSVDEAKYLLEHIVHLVINKGLVAAQKEAESKELMAKLHQERMDSTFQRDMLQYLIQDKVDIEIDDSLIRQRDDDSDSDSDNSSRSTSPVDSMLGSQLVNTGPNIVLPPPTVAELMLPKPMGSADSLTSSSASIPGKTVKARRKTATPEDLLYAGNPGGESPISPSSPLLPVVPETVEEEKPPPATSGPSAASSSSRKVNGSVTDSGSLMPPPKTVPIARHKPGTASARMENGRHEPTPSPSLPRKTYPGVTKAPPPEPSPSMRRRGVPTATTTTSSKSETPEPSPSMRRKVMTSSTTSSGSGSGSSRQNSISDSIEISITPPTSPQSTRRSFRNGNVFSRLTSASVPSSPHPNRASFAPPTRGVINSATARRSRSSPLSHSHTAVGHSKAVLSVFATDDLLFSSSKDRTAKIWDLASGEEIMTLDGHPNNVTSVRFSEETSLIYTVSTYFVKVWDVRQGNKCIRTLMSSGLSHDGPPQINLSTRQVSCPAGETIINDIALNSTGQSLYSAAGSTVRIWDLRTSKSVGKLLGGHQAAVMVLAIDDTDTADGNICVVTGSKDHYIKVFEVMEDSIGVLSPKCNLEPPHYDGIQSLCLMGDLLFSGSRDFCIKKWDLADQQLRQSINNAHKDWICGLAFMPGGNCLLSGCRGGMIKLWHIDNCSQLGEIKAHSSPINAIATNSSLIFTASDDRCIRIWQSGASFDPSDSSDNE